MRALDVVTLVLLCVGMALSLFALRRYANPANPPRMMWIWKMRDCFRGRGFALYMAGTEMIVLGALVQLIATIEHH